MKKNEGINYGKRTQLCKIKYSVCSRHCGNRFAVAYLDFQPYVDYQRNGQQRYAACVIWQNTSCGTVGKYDGRA